MDVVFDLLDAVQPEGGWFAVVGIGAHGNVRQIMVETREDVDRIAAALVNQGRNVFFGVAKYRTGENRTRDNVQALKALWLDVDCGPGKDAPRGYPSQADALRALRRFCETTGMPRPIIVNSGRGLHVYWALTQPVPRPVWESLAKALQKRCTEAELYVDPQVFEAARILRIPGTYNFKGDTPAEVTVLAPADPVSVDTLLPLLRVPEQTVEHAGRARQDKPKSRLAEKLDEFPPSLFSQVLVLGCAQLLNCVEERATLSEPLWRAALSIAKFCEDRQDATPLVSVDHPGYSEEATARKLDGILSPYTCARFEELAPAPCASCPHKGTISSPIELGRPKFTPTDTPPVSLPYGYVRGAGGGIYKNAAPDDEEGPQLVYEHDFFVLKRMRDPVLLDVVLFRLVLPHDGIRDFVIESRKVVDIAELRKSLAAEGVVCGTRQFGLLASYVIAAVNLWQKSRKAENMRLQFGWADHDRIFVVGDREIDDEGKITHSPPSTVTRNTAELLQPSGTFAAWQTVFDMYGQPGMEAHAFAAATAFGAPLLRFFGQRGSIINLIHPQSGTGKTTVLQMCNSVWGHPARLCCTNADTENSKVMRIGIMRNLPVTFDEMTNTDPKQLSDLAYLITHGRGKERMKSSANELRFNATTWQTIALCSSNESFYDKLAGMKIAPEGEMMRILEYTISNDGLLSAELAKHSFDHVLMQNYGHAGQAFMQYVMKNQEQVAKQCLEAQQKIDRELHVSPKERVWSATIAANMVGALIAVQQRLIQWDIPAIYQWVGSRLHQSRVDVGDATMRDSMELLGLFLNEHVNNMLVINGRGTKKDRFTQREPRGALYIRYEPDSRRLSISSRALINFCGKVRGNYRNIVKMLTDDGILIDQKMVRLATGAATYAGNSVHCLVLDTNYWPLWEDYSGEIHKPPIDEDIEA